MTDATTAKPIEPHPPGLDELHIVRKVTGRELGMRKRLYPAWVKAGRMAATSADFERDGMGLALGLARGMVMLWPKLTAEQRYELRMSMADGAREAQA